MQPAAPADRPVARFAKDEDAVIVESIKQRADRIRSGQADRVDLTPGRLFGDVEQLLRIVGRGGR